jgi:hypothetical protein
LKGAMASQTVSSSNSNSYSYSSSRYLPRRRSRPVVGVLGCSRSWSRGRVRGRLPAGFNVPH